MGAELKILHLEDDENDAFFFEMAIGRVAPCGTYRRVKDGLQGVDYMLGRSNYTERGVYPIPNLIICDLKMPGMDGFEFIRWLRTHGDFSRIPVIVLSASEMERDKAAACHVGANEFLTKPTTFFAWSTLVQSLVENFEALQKNADPAMHHGTS